MSFCAECGKTIPKNAKFCPGCGAKVITELNEEIKENTDFDDVQDAEIVEELNQADSNEDDNSEEETETKKEIIETKKEEWNSLTDLQQFFTIPRSEGNFDKSSDYSNKITEIKNHIEQYASWNVKYGMLFVGCLAFTFLFFNALVGSTVEFDIMLGQCFTGAFALATLGVGLAWNGDRNRAKEKIEELDKLEAKRKMTDRGAIDEMRKEKEWLDMSPLPLFKRLEEAQEIVAKSSYENLGIDEGDTTRSPAYCYGPHLEIFGDIFGERTDQTGIGKGADYYKFCEKKGLEGLYTREYDMMIVQFTENQIMVYKCIFDILEMTKRLEESYEWNYKHVVGINITGDEKEKDLGGGIAVTGTKYLVISAASGDKIEIVLGAGTRKVDSSDGKEKRTSLGGEEKIYEVANEAMKNIREAVRKGAK